MSLDVVIITTVCLDHVITEPQAFHQQVALHEQEDDLEDEGHEQVYVQGVTGAM